MRGATLLLHISHSDHLLTCGEQIDCTASPYRGGPVADAAIDRVRNMIGTTRFLWGRTKPNHPYVDGKPLYRYEYEFDVNEGDVIGVLTGWLWHYILYGKESNTVPDHIFRRFMNAVGRSDREKCRAWIAADLPADPFARLFKSGDQLIEPFDQALIAWPHSDRTTILSTYEHKSYWYG